MEQPIESTLRGFARVLLRRAWLVVVAVTMAVAVAVALSLASTKIYAATSQVLVEPQAGSATADTQSGADAADVATHVEVIKARPVAAEVARRLGQNAGLVTGVRVRPVGSTRVINITVESAEPVVARDGATAYARVYVEQRRVAAAESLQETGRVFSQRAQEAKAKLDDLDRRIASAPPAAQPPLRTERDALAAQYAEYQRRADESSAEAPRARGSVELVQEAALPGDPVRPRPVRNGMLALLVGLVIGVGAAFVFERFDDTVKTRADLERHSAGKTLVGSIPAVTDWRDRDEARLVTVEQPTAAVSEAYRSLRASVQSASLHRPVRTVVVTSPTAGEGKSTTVANLGVALARSGHRVTCVDCDLREPRLHKFFRIPATVGFTSVLLGDQPLSVALQQVTVVGGGSLRILAAGPLPPNPDELLATDRVPELLTAVAAGADIVLIDAPPLLLSGTLALASRVDGVLVVAMAGITRRRDLARAVDLLDEAGAETLGVVLNGVAGPDDAAAYQDKYSTGIAAAADRLAASR